MKKYALSVSLSVCLLAVAFTGCKKDSNPGSPKKLECEYTTDFTLTNHNPDGADYECDCEVDISAGTFTIQPGVEILFKSGGALYAHNEATFKATGTANAPIIMSDAEGSWKGLALYSDKDANELNYVEIENAGNYDFGTVIAGFIHDNKASVIVNGKAKISNTIVRGSKGYGIAYLASSECKGFSGNQISNSNGYPLFIYAGELDNTSLASCSFTGNSKNYIGIYSKTSNGTVTEEVNLIQTPVPYYGITELNFTNVARLAAGTTIVMSNDKGIYVTGNQYMQINGTANNPVTMKGESEVAGFWKGILVNTNNPNNVFNYLNITDGGSSGLGLMPANANMAMGDAAEAKLTLNHCTSERYNGYQVSINSATNFVNNSPGIINIHIQ